MFFKRDFIAAVAAAEDKGISGFFYVEPFPGIQFVLDEELFLLPGWILTVLHVSNVHLLSHVHAMCVFLGISVIFFAHLLFTLCCGSFFFWTQYVGFWFRMLDSVSFRWLLFYHIMKCEKSQPQM